MVTDFELEGRATRNTEDDLHRKCITYVNDCSWTRIQKHVVRKPTLNHLAKLAK